MTATKADVDHTESVLEDRVTGIDRDVAITAMLRLIVKMTVDMDVHEKVRASLLLAHYGGKVATSVVSTRGVD